MSSGIVVAVAAVVLAVALGLYRRVTDGRFRTSAPSPATASASAPSEPAVAPVVTPSVLEGTPWAGQAGERATLLQFSSAFCAPCRTTRQVLSGVAEEMPGVVHVEVDAELHLDVVRRLGVLRTPTTLLLDADGVELTRAGGVPHRDQVRRVLGATADGDPAGP